MYALQQVMEELENSLKNRSSSERLQVLRSITDLFLCGVGHQSEEHVSLFDDALCRLVNHVESRAIAQLSAELAPIDHAPIRIVRQLARHDDVAISGPLLKESKRLEAEDLIEIAQTKSQAHLAAIASRPQLEAIVTDVLVDKGNTEVAKVVANNVGARFSQAGLSKLVTRAEKEEGLAELVAIRSDISPHQLRQLAAKATDTVRQRLMTTANPEANARIERILVEIADEVGGQGAAEKRNYFAARRLYQSIQHDPALVRSTLAEVAARDDFEATVVLLSGLSGIKLKSVEQTLVNSDGGTLILCKALRIDWPTARAILSLRAANNAPPVKMDNAFEQFAKISEHTAQRVVRFWQIRTTVGDADPPRQSVDPAAKSRDGAEHGEVAL